MIDTEGKMMAAIFACFVLGISNAFLVMTKKYWELKGSKKFFGEKNDGGRNAFFKEVVSFSLNFAHYALSYLLMLLAMSYYVGLFISVCLGERNQR